MRFFSFATQLSFDLFRRRTPEPVRLEPAIRSIERRFVAEDSQDLTELWESVRLRFFPDLEHLKNYRVTWSTRRHRSTLASCNVYRNKVSVAPVMKLPDAAPHLEALIYHEMCHAALGKPAVINGRRVVHGRDFKQLEKAHPGIHALDIWIKSGGWRNSVKTYNRTLGRRRRISTPTSYRRA